MPVLVGTGALGWDLERAYLKPLWNHKDDSIKNLALLPRFISASRMLRSQVSSSLALAFPIISERQAKIWTPFLGHILRDHYLGKWMQTSTVTDNMISWSNLSKVTKASFSWDTLKLCNPSYTILEVNTVSKQLSDQIFVQKWLRNKLQFCDRTRVTQM